MTEGFCGVQISGLRCAVEVSVCVWGGGLLSHRAWHSGQGPRQRRTGQRGACCRWGEEKPPSGCDFGTGNACPRLPLRAPVTCQSAAVSTAHACFLGPWICRRILLEDHGERGTWRVDSSSPPTYSTARTLVYTSRKQTPPPRARPKVFLEKPSYLFTIKSFFPMAWSLHARLHLWSSSIKPLTLGSARAGGSIMECSQLTLSPMAR